MLQDSVTWRFSVGHFCPLFSLKRNGDGPEKHSALETYTPNCIYQLQLHVSLTQPDGELNSSQGILKTC